APPTADPLPTRPGPRSVDPPPAAAPTPPPLGDEKKGAPSKQAQADEYVKLLKHRDPRERIKAVQGLAALGDAADGAGRALCQATLDNNPKVATAAIDALEAVRPDLHPALVPLLVDREPHRRQQALRDLEQMGPRGNAAVPVVVAYMQRA